MEKRVWWDGGGGVEGERVCMAGGEVCSLPGAPGPWEVKEETKIYPMSRHRWGETGQRKEALLLHDTHFHSLCTQSVQHLTYSIHFILATLCEVGLSNPTLRGEK